MRVLFTDIEGVLATCASMGRSWHTRLPRADLPGKDSPITPLEATCVERFNRIVRLTDAEVVVCSIWGREFQTGPLCAYLRSNGVDSVILGRTPVAQQYRIRGEDIQQWLDEATAPIESFCILDDHDDMGPLRDRLVQTKHAAGLQDQDVERAVRLLLS